jgi:hypothetical protein
MRSPNPPEENSPDRGAGRILLLRSRECDSEPAIETAPSPWWNDRKHHCSWLPHSSVQRRRGLHPTDCRRPGAMKARGCVPQASRWSRTTLMTPSSSHALPRRVGGW